MVLNVRVILLVVLCTVLVTGTMAHAIPYAEFRYTETDLHNGAWQYDYTLYNMADPITDSGFNVWDAMITFAPAATFATVSSPVGWDTTIGSGFYEITSSIPGLPIDGGFDLGPGSALSGISFILDYRAASLGFDAYFINPNDPDGFSLNFVGRTAPEAAPVPEPSSLILVAVGMSSLLLRRRKHE